MRPVVIILTVLSAASTVAQTVIEDFADVAVYSADSSFVSAPFPDPWQWSQQSDFIRFEPRNGGNPRFNSSVTFQNFSGISFDDVASITLTARAYEPPPASGVVQIGLAGSYYGVQLTWDFLAIDFFADDPISITLDLAAAQTIGTPAGEMIELLALRTFGSHDDFRMEFHELTATSSAAVPEPSTWAAIAGAAALLGAIATRCTRNLRP